jgi:SUN domain-containing protein 1/2
MAPPPPNRKKRRTSSRQREDAAATDDDEQDDRRTREDDDDDDDGSVASNTRSARKKRKRSGSSASEGDASEETEPATAAARKKTKAGSGKRRKTTSSSLKPVSEQDEEDTKVGAAGEDMEVDGREDDAEEEKKSEPPRAAVAGGARGQNGHGAAGPPPVASVTAAPPAFAAAAAGAASSVASAAAPAAPEAAAARKKRSAVVPPVSHLRMPSKHTPGRLRERETERLPGRRSAAEAAANASAAAVLPVPRRTAATAGRRLVLDGDGEASGKPAAEPAATERRPSEPEKPRGENGEAPHEDRVQEEEQRPSFSDRCRQQMEIVKERLTVWLERPREWLAVFRERIVPILPILLGRIMVYLGILRAKVVELLPAAWKERTMKLLEKTGIIKGPEVEETIEEEEQDEGTKNWRDFLRNPIVWLLIPVLFHALLFRRIHSWSVNVSNRAYPFYRDLVTPSPYCRVTMNASLSEDMMQDRNVELERIQRELVESQNTVDEDLSYVRLSVEHVDSLLQTQEQNLVAMDAENAIKMLKQLAAKKPLDFLQHPPFPQLREALGDAESSLIDLSAVELWNLPAVDLDCSKVKTEHVPKDEVDRRATELIAEFEANAREAKEQGENEESVEAWIRDTATEAWRRLLQIEAREESAALTASKSLQKTIAERLERESADQTGRVDYASIQNGGSVIRTGDWATSPSLVDELPFLNRMAAALSLRFYGYGPEAALTPTYPPGSLGQCWAFQPQQQEQPDGQHGAIGMFTVRLARRIRVRTISIEHPPPELSDRTDTAIREFRVVGFEDAEAQSKKAWNLGSFEYLRDRIRKDFGVAYSDDGVDIPPLRAISLAIDSNWGGNYTCIYRFRVHGEETE